ncbi:hypothetical protein LZ31DRAFT_294195 [Colletotrichum somersetense]|nr:hypothetical protein LZ31DRAFT_294195 [Colletotrichum somersetense]
MLDAGCRMPFPFAPRFFSSSSPPPPLFFFFCHWMCVLRYRHKPCHRFPYTPKTPLEWTATYNTDLSFLFHTPSH